MAQAKRDAVRLTPAQAPVQDHNLVYARYLMDSLTPQLRSVADAFYPDAHELCQYWANQTGYSVNQVAGVMALYSINNAWPNNIVMARNAVVHNLVVGMGITTRNANAILAGEPIHHHLTHGSKVNNFYHCIMLSPYACTNDRWQFRVFDRPQSERWYPWVTECTRAIADEYGIDELWRAQARLWYACILDWARQGDKGGMQSVAMLGLKDMV